MRSARAAPVSAPGGPPRPASPSQPTVGSAFTAANTLLAALIAPVASPPTVTGPKPPLAPPIRLAVISTFRYLISMITLSVSSPVRKICTALIAWLPRPGTVVIVAGGSAECLGGLASPSRSSVKVYVAFAVALPVPGAVRLGGYAVTKMLSTRNTGFASTVYVHWLCAVLACGWTAFAVPLSSALSSVAPSTLQALGTTWNSPFWNVVTNGLFGAGELASHRPAATSTTTSTADPPQVTSLRLERRRRAAATLLRPGLRRGRTRPGSPAGGY